MVHKVKGMHRMPVLIVYESDSSNPMLVDNCRELGRKRMEKRSDFIGKSYPINFYFGHTTVKVVAELPDCDAEEIELDYKFET